MRCRCYRDFSHTPGAPQQPLEVAVVGNSRRDGVVVPKEVLSVHFACILDAGSRE